MRSMRVIYHLALADFLERVRRYSFLVMLALIVFLGYQVAIGNMTLTLGQYRGEFNSAWVGAMMSLNATFLIGWFGFFLVKGSIARDRETGVGQIIATTPLSRPLYLLGKWLSNFAVLMAMVTVLALAGIALQIWKGESAHIDLMVYLEPFIYIVLPLMALVAAFAVFFETIPFLKGGFGNIVYLVAFLISIPLIMENTNSKYVMFEPTGIGIFENTMGKDVRAIYPDYDGGFSLGPAEETNNTFTWEGVNWTSDLILARFALIGLGILLTLFAALFFDRFDPSHTKPKKRQISVSPAAHLQAAPVLKVAPAVQLTSINQKSQHFSFFNVIKFELKLLLKGQRWWWYLVAGGLIIACFANTSEITRQIVLPIAWVWPVLVWSGLGNREIHNNVQQMTFSSASPLWRQLPAQWLAGFMVTFLLGIGAFLRFTMDGDTTGMLAFLSGAIFIPSLALTSGVWSGSSKLFEIIYILIWYMGPLNRVLELDYSGAHSSGRPGFFIPLSLVLLVMAFVRRARQVRN
ncbi:MAG: ABC transporter permease subunit [Anaerolineales bacterium]